MCVVFYLGSPFPCIVLMRKLDRPNKQGIACYFCCKYFGYSDSFHLCYLCCIVLLHIPLGIATFSFGWTSCMRIWQISVMNLGSFILLRLQHECTFVVPAVGSLSPAVIAGFFCWNCLSLSVFTRVQLPVYVWEYVGSLPVLTVIQQLFRQPGTLRLSHNITITFLGKGNAPPWLCSIVLLPLKQK